MEVFLVMLHTFSQESMFCTMIANYPFRLHGYAHYPRIIQL